MYRDTFLAAILALAVVFPAVGCAQNRFFAQPGGSASNQAAVEPPPSNPSSGGGLLGAVNPFRRTSSKPAAKTGASSVDSALAFARLSERRGNKEQAEQLYLGVMQRAPENAVPLHRLGVMRAKEGRFEEANDLLVRASELDPQNVEILADLGYCYYLQDRLDDAEAALRHALTMRPNDRAVCNNLALVYGDQRRYEEALALFRRNGKDAEAYANLAYVVAQQGELEQAAELYNYALTLDPNLRPAAHALIHLAARTNAVAAPVISPGEVIQATATAPPHASPPAAQPYSPAGFPAMNSGAAAQPPVMSRPNVSLDTLSPPHAAVRGQEDLAPIVQPPSQIRLTNATTPAAENSGSRLTIRQPASLESR